MIRLRCMKLDQLVEERGLQRVHSIVGC
jgi:hypothetical protein